MPVVRVKVRVPVTIIVEIYPDSDDVEYAKKIGARKAVAELGCLDQENVQVDLWGPVEVGEPEVLSVENKK